MRHLKLVELLLLESVEVDPVDLLGVRCVVNIPNAPTLDVLLSALRIVTQKGLELGRVILLVFSPLTELSQST